MGMELVGPSKRTLAGIVCWFFETTGKPKSDETPPIETKPLVLYTNTEHADIKGCKDIVCRKNLVFDVSIKVF